MLNCVVYVAVRLVHLPSEYDHAVCSAPFTMNVDWFPWSSVASIRIMKLVVPKFLPEYVYVNVRFPTAVSVWLTLYCMLVAPVTLSAVAGVVVGAGVVVSVEVGATVGDVNSFGVSVAVTCGEAEGVGDSDVDGELGLF